MASRCSPSSSSHRKGASRCVRTRRQEAALTPILSLRALASCSHTVGSSTVRNPACSIHKHTSLRGVGRVKVTVSKPGPKGSSVTLGHLRHRPDSRLGCPFHASRFVVGSAVSAVPVRHPQRLGAGRNGANVVLPRRNVAMENRRGEPSEFGIMGKRHVGRPRRLDTHHHTPLCRMIGSPNRCFPASVVQRSGLARASRGSARRSITLPSAHGSSATGCPHTSERALAGRAAARRSPGG